MAVGANQLVLGAAGLWPRSRLLGPNLVRLPAASAARGEVALTFDDGPDPLVTPRVLDLLDRHGAQASFFCVGRQAAAHPRLVAEIAARGHSVENHSDRHPRAFACYGLAAIRREVESCQAMLSAITGRPPRFFRAPMGLRNPLLEPVLAGAGLRYVSWTRRGYDAVAGEAGPVLRRLTHRLAAGDVLLLHDGSPGRPAGAGSVALSVLPALLDCLAARGLAAVALPAALGEAAGTLAQAAGSALPALASSREK